MMAYTMYTFDSDMRPTPRPLPCPKCGYEHGYVWGYAQRGQIRPNGGCPSCRHTWELATGKALIELGRWVTNAARDLDATRVKQRGISEYDEHVYYVRWRRQFVEGPPKATERYTVEQLEAMGEIGLYEPRGESSP